MTDNLEIIKQLTDKIDMLLEKHEMFSKEIIELRDEIYTLKTSELENIYEEEEETVEVPPTKTPFELQREKIMAEMNVKPKEKYTHSSANNTPPQPKTPKLQTDIEKFIGENLINKIGIFITIIGVAIGAKYSIDHQLISPLTRIILGYLVGVGLLGVGLKLKKNYENYSAVLVSGAMAIMYFITFAAYSFYDLYPQFVAFALMVVFTVFTVVAALNYNNQIISLIGLVGAYAVPFLLSDGSGRVAVLYSYMAIINIGILVIAFKKYWKILYYSSFALTWVIYASWFSTQYKFEEHFAIAATFLLIFFLIFYATFLAYKLIRKEKFEIEDVALLLVNSFIFYGIGYSMMYGHATLENNLGLFTVGNAFIHLIVSAVIYKQKLGDRNLFYLVSGLFLVFITIAIPVQLHGHWIILLWAAEAALLFWIGRTKSVTFYETLSYPLMFLAFFSVLRGLSIINTAIDQLLLRDMPTPFYNITFLTSLIFVSCFGIINIINQNKNYTAPWQGKDAIPKLMSYVIPGIFLISLYFTFLKEITNYWGLLLKSSEITINIKGQTLPDIHVNYDLEKLQVVWIINYSLLFFSILSFINIKKIKNANLGYVNLAINTFVVLMFLTFGLYMLSELRDSYLQQTLSQYYYRGVFHIIIRYISFAFVATIIYAIYKYIEQEFLDIDLKIAFDIMLFITILWIASSELINWMDIAHSTQSYKLGLSILWGIYSLMLIALGIWKKGKHLRIGAIIIFGLTLAKLFLYDISYLDTISKTIVFVSLGILLLIISFLYNKYKNIISGDTEE